MSIELSGTDNFRSLKGLPASGGRSIAGHTVLRSDQLHRLGEEGWQAMRSLGVKTVCDLRGPAERSRYPNQLPPEGVRQLAMELLSDVRADPGFAMTLRDKPNADGAVDMMREIYRRMPGMLARHLPSLFGLFESGEVPVLIHCAAGKDRTGFTVAVVLHALGVPTDIIFEDYLLSARSAMVSNPHKREQMSQMVFQLIGQTCSEPMIDAILDVRPVYLQTALDTVVEQYGSMDAYLASAAGMDATAVERLRERWLTPA